MDLEVMLFPALPRRLARSPVCRAATVTDSAYIKQVEDGPGSGGGDLRRRR